MFIRWLDNLLSTDLFANTGAFTSIEHWIVRFGIPSIRTTDKEQFHHLFLLGTTLLGIKHFPMIPKYLENKSLIECLHRCFEQSLKCHNNPRLILCLSLVFLGLRSALNLRITPAKCVTTYRNCNLYHHLRNHHHSFTRPWRPAFKNYNMFPFQSLYFSVNSVPVLKKN